MRPAWSPYPKYRVVVNRHVRKVHVYLAMATSLIMMFFGLTGFMLNHEKWFLLKAAEGAASSVRQAPLPKDEALDSRDARVAFLREAFDVTGEVASADEEGSGRIVLRDGRLRHTAEFDAASGLAQVETVETASIPRSGLAGGREVIVPLAKEAFGVSGVCAEKEYAMITEPDGEGREFQKAVFTVRRPGANYSMEVNLTSGEAVMTREENGVAALLMDLHRGSGAPWGMSGTIDVAAWSLVVVGLSGFLLGTALQKRRRVPSYAVLLLATFATLWVLWMTFTA